MHSSCRSYADITISYCVHSKARLGVAHAELSQADTRPNANKGAELVGKKKDDANG